MQFQKALISCFLRPMAERCLHKHSFLHVPEHVKNYAYEDISLPLGEGSKISKPSEIAFILEHLELKKGQKILEIGSGSGYVLALMASIIKEGEIYGLEINEPLAIKAKQRLDNLPWVHIVRRDGYRGLPEYEP